MSRAFAFLCALLLACVALPAQAQTRAWLDRSEITYGESVALNVETDQAVTAIDAAPLRQKFDIVGQTLRTSTEWTNGRSRRRTLLALGLRPHAPGVLTIPPLQVGNATTVPLRLVVLPAATQPASANSDVFVETEVDAARPYVQQSVAVTVRLNYAVPLLSGQLDQDPPENASLQQVGEDLRYSRVLEGRRYNVIERHFLLIPERSGTLLLPGARFNGLRGVDSLDALFDNDRQPLSAAAPTRRLEVQPIPAAAPQPWLPLRSLELRYLRKPTRARAGAAVEVEIGMTAEGASDVQLPPLQLDAAHGVQVFADPAETDTRLVEGHLRASVRRTFALVPSQAGQLTIPGPKVVWWDAGAGVARTTQLPPLELDVAPAAGAAASATPGPAAGPQDRSATAPAASGGAVRTRALMWAAGGLALLAVLGLGGYMWRQRRLRAARRAASVPGPAEARAVSLAAALAGDDLAAIAGALVRQAGATAEDLDAVQAGLEDPAQQAAVARLQAARWGAGDPQAALRALRSAFAGGARWRRAPAEGHDLLPPLYPD